jgi:CP family cyanate transporter-like MFS transporter
MSLRSDALDPTAGSPVTMSATPAASLRWFILLGVWLVYFTFGLTAMSLAPLVEPITRDLGIGHGTMGLIFGVWQLTFIVSGVPCGMLLDRLGPRRALFLGIATVALSSLLRSVAPDYVAFALAVALFGLGAPVISAGAPKVISLWFRGQDRGLAMGIYMTGPSLGGIVALSLTNSVLMPGLGDDWHRVLQLWSALAFCAGLLWLGLTVNPAARGMGVTLSGEKPPSQRRVLVELARLPAVRILLLMSIGIFGFNHALNSWLPTLLRHDGMSAAQAGYWATIPTLIGIAGSLVIPRLATPRRRYRLLAWLCVCAALASLMLHAGSGPVLLAGLVLQGIARSSLMTICMLTLVETPGIGERHAGIAAGMFFAAAEMGGAAGPIVLGLLYDYTHAFGAGLWLLTVVAVLLFCGVMMLMRLARQRGAPPAATA